MESCDIFKTELEPDKNIFEIYPDIIPEVMAPNEEAS